MAYTLTITAVTRPDPQRFLVAWNMLDASNNVVESGSFGLSFAPASDTFTDANGNPITVQQYYINSLKDMANRVIAVAEAGDNQFSTIQSTLVGKSYSGS